MLYLNGIDATTGDALWPSAAPDVLKLAETLAPSQRSALSRFGAAVRLAVLRAISRGPLLGPLDRDGVDLSDPRTVGWAIAIASDAPSEAVAAANRLFEHRLNHSGIPRRFCKRLVYPAGVSADQWMRAEGAHGSDVDPKRLPYYVTLVGQPTSVSFDSQSQLGCNRAVGRLAFDEPAGYHAYVDSVVEYESSKSPPGNRDIAYWGPSNPRDRATTLSASCLIRPLAGGDPAEDLPPIAELRGFRSHLFCSNDATAESLDRILSPRSAFWPSVVFTASHGLGWPLSHRDQLSRQGALVGHEWEGPGVPPKRTDCFSADDVNAETRVSGLIAFMFACFGAGTPARELSLAGPGKALAKRPFVSALPQRLLSHPSGGALAVIGHVERAWACSIRPPNLSATTLPFENFLSKVMRGWPVGLAMEDFSQRYSRAAIRICEQRAARDHQGLNLSWIEYNDAKNYIVLGDPAVRLRVDSLT